MPYGPRVLLVGYNGANNTGAEARVMAAIEDVRAVLGRDTPITVPTLDIENTRRYIRNAPDVRLVHIPPMFFLPMRKLIRDHDVVVLVEGSVYMDTWSSLFLWYFLWATRQAHAFGKPCLAYAIDVGSASEANQAHIRREASKVDLIVTRTRLAAETLRRWGVTAPIEVTADIALTLPIDAGDAGLMAREWPDAADGAVGLAMVDFYRFPVVIRPWGRSRDRFSWPVYFAHSTGQRSSSAALTAGYAAQIDRLVEKAGRHVALMCMEELDEPIAKRVQASLRHPEMTRIFSARDHNASQMTSLLRGLELLITARYHGSVLALGGLRPQIAFGHDLRLKTLYQELGLYPGYFVDARDSRRFEALAAAIDRALAEPNDEVALLRRGHQDQLSRARANRDLLARFASAHGWRTVTWAA